MCCLVCLSFRGAAYFGTTTQILLGLGIVIKYSPALPAFKITDSLFSGGTGQVGVLFPYGLLIFLFGCCIFRGIECGRLRLLKVAVGGFTFMQCLVLVTHLTLIAMTFEELKEDERMHQVSVLALNLVLTFLHLTALFLYMIRLTKRREVALSSRSPRTSESQSLALSSPGGSKSEGNGGRYSVGSSITMSSMGQRYLDGRWEDLHNV